MQVRGVAVGVDGSEHGYAAARYAAREALRLDARLDLVHVIPADVPLPSVTGPSFPAVSLQAYAQEILAKALVVATEIAPGLDVRTHLCSGSRVHQLLAFAEESDLLVLGSRSPRTFDHIWTGGTLTAVAGSASCPVIVVPADWDSSVLRGRIVLGIRSAELSQDLVAAGFDLAADLGVELVVLHAWRLEGVYNDMIADRVSVERWHQDQARLLDDLLAAHREARPDVPVHVFVRHEEPAHALVRVSGGADRLLIQRPAHARPGRHVGRVARALLREARCPVQVIPVVPLPAAPPAPDTTRELVS